MANPSPVSRKGKPNKSTKALKDMLLDALTAKGGQAWIEKQMDDNPGAVLSLLGKTIPKDLALTGSMSLKVITGVDATD